MKPPRGLPPIGYIIEVAVEAFVAGVFAAMGEAVVTESVKKVKRYLKKRRKSIGRDERL